MNKLRAMVLILAGLGGAFGGTAVRADEQAGSASGEIIRVGGDYVVESIDQSNGQAGRVFKVVFKADKPTGRFDTLKLESDHVHVAVKVGQKMRLSAEILGESGATAEVAQVVIFFEGQSGRVPVWMLSTKAPNRDLRASKYLEMHVPANDFMVM